MKKSSKKTNHVFLVVLIAGAAAGAFLLLNGCSILEAQIGAMIKQSNYCDTKADCIIAGYGCPFGCYNLVNSDAEPQLTVLFEQYRNSCSRCAYSCIRPPELQDIFCKSGKCVAAGLYGSLFRGTVISPANPVLAGNMSCLAGLRVNGRYDPEFYNETWGFSGNYITLCSSSLIPGFSENDTVLVSGQLSRTADGRGYIVLENIDKAG